MTGEKPARSPSRRRLAAFLVVPLVVLAFAPGPQDKTAPFPRHGGYIGRADCAECHEEEETKILEGVHGRAIHDPTHQECETCHGPARAHADDEDNDTGLISHPHKLGADVQIRLCGRCHQDQIEGHGGDLKGFLAAGKKCTSCHTIHTKKQPALHPEVAFRTRKLASATAKPIGAKKCISCHPLRNDLLEGTGHAQLMANSDPNGCETCHGNGSLHVETGGLARLITRPDQAGDGAATCLSCHAHVDAVEFHWKGKHKPLLSAGMTCATCHTVHAGRHDVVRAKGPKVTTPMATAPRVTAPRVTAPEVTTWKATTPGHDSRQRSQPKNGGCAKCHAPAYGILEHTIHESLGRKDIPLGQGCGGCHEGAAEHAAGPGRKKLVNSMHGTDAAYQSKTCAKCHQQDAAMKHTRLGSHFKNQVTCLTCHSPAAKKGKVREDASQKCAKCHTQQAAEFRMPNHHPVKIGDHGRGTMTCVDCHEPHGARPRIRDRQLREQACVKCHKQYRGPFVYAHQASRTEGCVACHSPHGSTNRRMLKQHTTQQNCLQCHGDFPSFHDQTKGAVFTNCLQCHTEVHGSNHSRYLFPVMRATFLQAACAALVAGSLCAQSAPGSQPGSQLTPRVNRYFDLAYTLGYRWLDVDGSRNRWDSDYNLDDGFRLTHLRIDGHFLDTKRFPDRIRIESNNLADPFERHRIEFEKEDLYKASATFRRNRYNYRASGEFHRVDRKEQIAGYDLSVPIGDFEVFAGFTRSDFEGFWLTNRIGNRNLTPLYSITNVRSPRVLREDEGELGVSFAAGGTSVSLAAEWLDQNENNSWIYSQPSVGNPAFLESETLGSGASLEGPGARFHVGHHDGPLDISVDGRWLDRRRRIVGAGTGSGFDTNPFTTTTTSLSEGAARTTLLDGAITYELTDDLALHTDLRYLDHREHLFIDQLDVTVYPSLSTTIPVRTMRDQRTVSRLREATAELDWAPTKSLTLTGGWGWSQEKLQLPDLEGGDADFAKGTVIEDGFLVAANWRPDAHWTVKGRYRDFGQGGLRLHEVVDRHTRGARGSLGYRKDSFWWELGVNHSRSQNPVADSRSARTAYTATTGYAPDDDLDFHLSYTLSDINSRVRTNFYFDPSPTPASTLVGFRGESHSAATGLEWRLHERFHTSVFGAYTTVHGDFELDLYHWGVDLAWMLERRGRVGIRIEQMDYHEAGNPDDYDAWMTYLYLSAEIRGQRPR